MSKNPFYNAIIALGYIVILVTVVMNTPNFVGHNQTALAPMGMLSLLVLSVALMAYLFFYQPVLMFIEGDRQGAVKLFLKTVGVFAIGTAVVLLAALVLSYL